MLKGVAQNLGIHVEEVKESSDSLVDILTAAGLSRLALPLSEVIMVPIKALWQSSASLPHTTKKAKNYLVLAQGYEFLYTYSGPGSLVVSAVNECEWQGLQGVTPAKQRTQSWTCLGGRSAQLGACSS